MKQTIQTIIKEKTRHYLLWSSVIAYFASTIGAFINALLTPEAPVLIVIAAPIALLLGLAVLFMFIAACMAPFTSKDDMFILQLLPDNFWRTSYMTFLVLMAACIASILLI